MLNVLAYEIFKSGKDADVTDVAKRRAGQHGGRCEIKFNQNLPPNFASVWSPKQARAESEPQHVMPKRADSAQKMAGAA